MYIAGDKCSEEKQIRVKGVEGSWGCYFNSVGKGLTDKVGLEQRPEGSYGDALQIPGGRTFQTEVTTNQRPSDGMVLGMFTDLCD